MWFIKFYINFLVILDILYGVKPYSPKYGLHMYTFQTLKYEICES